MATTIPEKIEAKKTAKHEKLEEAIDRLDELKRYVLILSADIHNEILPIEECKEVATSSLIDILNNGPNTINERCDSIYKILEGIRTELFG